MQEVPSSFWQHLQTVNWALWSIFQALFYHFLKKKNKFPFDFCDLFLAPPERTMPKWQSHSVTRMIIHVFHKWICSMQSCLWKFSLSWWKKLDELLKSGIVDYTSLRLFLFNLAKIPRGYDWSQKDKNELCWESINQGWYKRCD